MEIRVQGFHLGLRVGSGSRFKKDLELVGSSSFRILGITV